MGYLYVRLLSQTRSCQKACPFASGSKFCSHHSKKPIGLVFSLFQPLFSHIFSQPTTQSVFACYRSRTLYTTIISTITHPLIPNHPTQFSPSFCLPALHHYNTQQFINSNHQILTHLTPTCRNSPSPNILFGSELRGSHHHLPFPSSSSSSCTHSFCQEQQRSPPIDSL